MRKDTCGVTTRTLLKEGISGSQPVEKARMLNEQFSSVFTREDINNISDLGPSPLHFSAGTQPKHSTRRLEDSTCQSHLSHLSSRRANVPAQKIIDQSLWHPYVANLMNISSLLEQHNILVDYQHGFRADALVNPSYWSQHMTSPQF